MPELLLTDFLLSLTMAFLAERIAHPPLGASAHFEYGVEVVIMENHGNRAAPSGWMMRLVSLLYMV